MANTLLTNSGINALINAHNSGVLAKPKTFAFSNQVITPAAELVVADITPWITKDISMVSMVQNSNIEFTCTVSPDEAVEEVKTIAIYLEDGTLFSVSAINGIGSGLKQTVKVQIDYENVDGLMDFVYVPTDYYDLQLSILDTSVSLGLQEMENARQLGLVKNKIGVS